MRKKPILMPTVSQRIEGLSVVILVIAVIVFLAASAHTLYLFPVPDSYRWYGDETWMLIAWKNLLRHGRLIVPIALGSTLESSPGLLLGSPWLAALVYGLPQLLAPVDTDLITVGRTISFLLGLSAISLLGWTAYRVGISGRCVILAMALLVTTSSFTFATHSARYDMMTGVALLTFVAIFAIGSAAHENRPHRRRMLRIFFIGAIALLTAFTISPHLEVLLLPVTLYVAWRHDAFRSVKAAVAFFSGGALATLLLIAVYAIANHSISIARGITSDNQFGSVLNNLPIRHLFSWSAQSHQLWAKGYYLWNEAPLFAFLFPLILLSEAALLIAKRSHPTTAFITICFFLAAGSAIVLQSTLPYYLIHLLPLAALAFAAHLKEWSKERWLYPTIALASLALSVFIALEELPEVNHAGRMGKQIDEANTAAVQAAFEQEGRTREPNSPRPLVLTQAPAIHELLRDSSVRVMSEAFLFFPKVKETPESTITRLGVNYIVDYNRPMTAAYAEMVHHGTPIFYRAGPLLDRTVDYFHDTTSEMDTLTLYRVDRAP